MRFCLTLAAGLAAIAVCILLARYPARRVALPVLAYFLCLGATGVILAAIQQRGAGQFTHSYMQAWMCTATIGAFLQMAVCAAYFSRMLDVIMLLDCVCFAGGVCAYTWLSLPHQTLYARMLVVLNGIELGAGLFVLITIAHSSGNIETLLKLALGCYWFFDAVHNVSFAFERLNPHLKFVTDRWWIPDAITLAVMVLLIAALMRGQGELARQGTNQAMQAERTLVEG